jgi:putative colanic acid biosynthesis acetyltransferase WcaF
MNKIDLSLFNNSEYNTGRNIIIRTIWFFINSLVFQTYIFPFYTIKKYILILFGAKIGKNFVIKPSINIKYPWLLSIGDNVWIGEKVWIDNLTYITIKNNVCISQGAFLLTGNHNYKSKSFDLIVKEIILEEGVWIGANSIVCPGVVCKKYSILTVGAVAFDNLENYGIYKGNPAIKIRNRNIYENIDNYRLF